MCILWYHRNIKVNPTFLGFIKPSGGVNLTPYVLVGLDIKYADWCGWGNPAEFPIFSYSKLVASLSYVRGVIYPSFFMKDIMITYLGYTELTSEFGVSAV